MNLSKLEAALLLGIAILVFGSVTAMHWIDTIEQRELTDRLTTWRREAEERFERATIQHLDAIEKDLRSVRLRVVGECRTSTITSTTR